MDTLVPEKLVFLSAVEKFYRKIENTESICHSMSLSKISCHTHTSSGTLTQVDGLHMSQVGGRGLLYLTIVI